MDSSRIASHSLLRSYLAIDVLHEQREDIKVLGTLPCLRHLVFRVSLAPELQVMERCVVGPDAFPCLVSCEFLVRGGGVVPGLFPRGAMPRLQNFTFRVEPEHFRSGGGSTVDDLATSRHFGVSLVVLALLTILKTIRSRV